MLNSLKISKVYTDKENISQEEQFKELKMVEASPIEETEIFLDMQNGEYLQFDMTLPLQMLFDDVMTFVSKTDFE